MSAQLSDVQLNALADCVDRLINFARQRRQRDAVSSDSGPVEAAAAGAESARLGDSIPAARDNQNPGAANEPRKGTKKARAGDTSGGRKDRQAGRKSGMYPL